ncbi:hypothetical protein TYRP_021637 [Tyrophagus putrescentiae]|nr:hypothetical protein TYRP_021637 [Tyrophagus putrescentiae]
MFVFTTMSSAIKGMVSKNKIRYKEDGFDLDLSYISKQIIAMGFPAESIERFYRNHIQDVVRLFDSKHEDHYRIYNLCSESKRCYDTTKFHGQVNVEYSFKDHNPPPFSILKPFCEELSEWLNADQQNVAGIHCKAGKGRTGVMICAYLVHKGGFEDADGVYQVIPNAKEALEYYARYRTRDLKGVTIPSQKRYVFYYEELVKRKLEYSSVPLNLTSILLTSVPAYNGGGSYTLICKVYEMVPKSTEWTLVGSFNIESKRNARHAVFNLANSLRLAGDVRFVFLLKNAIGTATKVFHACLNTFFVEYGTDLSTVVSETCSRCDGKMTTVVSGSGSNSNGGSSSSGSSKQIDEETSSTAGGDPQAPPQDDASVINDDVSFLHLLYTSRDEASHHCDCTLANNPPDIYYHSSRSHGPHASNDTGIHNASLPSTTSSLNCHEGKSSIASSVSDLQFSKPVKRDLFLVLPKAKIDKAYKSSKFPCGFKVVLGFAPADTEMRRQATPLHLKENHYIAAHPFEDTSSSETENEYTGSEDEVSDLENNPTERNIAYSSNGRLNNSNNNKGVSPPCSQKLV